MRTQLLSFALCLLLAACHGAAPGGPAPAQRLLSTGDTAAHFGAISQGIGEQVIRQVVRDSAEWQAQWSRLAQQYTPSPALPAVDFQRETVVIVTAGRFSGTGPFIRIDSAHAAHGTARVFVRTGRCHGPSFGGHAMVHPIDIVRLPGTYRHVTFVEHETRFPGCLDRTAP